MKQWYKIEYTVYNTSPEKVFEGIRLPANTTWYIDDYYTESVRKAIKFLKEHPDGNMKIVYR